MAPVWENRGGWWPIIRESFTTAWQHDVALTVDRNFVLSNHAVYACMTLVASDIAKMRLRLVEYDKVAGIWKETSSPSFSPVLQKPNHFQTRIQFIESWVISKLSRGNAYVLKERDARGVVVAMYVLDAGRVTPLVADNGEVFYRLAEDNLSGVGAGDIVVPASEIMHDRKDCLFHPLVGVSPIFAAGTSATQGLRIQNQSAKFFGNGAMPSGLLIAPKGIDEAQAAALKESWETKFTGDNAGKIAVLAGELSYQPMTMTSSDAQLIEQLKWTAEQVCGTFHVPPYKIGLGAMPTNNNVQSLNVEYYMQALQRHIEDIELCLDEGLGLTTPKDGRILGTEFDLDGLLRMDSLTQMEVLLKGKDVMTPDEARRRIDLPPTPGGDVVYRQQQDFSLEALAKRDAKDDPFSTGEKAPLALPAPDPEPEPDDTERAVAALRFKYAEALHAA